MRCSSLGEAGVLLVPDQGIEAGEQLLGVGSNDERPVLELGSAVKQGVGDVDRIGVSLLGMGGEAAGDVAQCLWRLCRDRPGDLRWAGGLSLDLDRLGLWGLFEDQVGVGAADAEGGDAGPPGRSALRPRPCLAKQLDLP